MIFHYCYFSEKTSLDISCESSAKQTIHMKCPDLFSLNNNNNNNKLSSAAVVTGALRVKYISIHKNKGCSELEVFLLFQHFLFLYKDTCLYCDIIKSLKMFC